MKWLTGFFTLVGALTVMGLASVALGVLYLWRKDRQWEQELYRTSRNAQTVSPTPSGTTGAAESSTAPEPAVPKAEATAGRSSKTASSSRAKSSRAQAGGARASARGKGAGAKKSKGTASSASKRGRKRPSGAG